MQDNEWIKEINKSYEWQLAEHLSAEEGETCLAEKLDWLIRNDFSSLVQLLYRIDISEARLRQLLQTNTGQDAGKIIARLIIERLIKKIETRRQYKRGYNDIPDEERW